VDSLAGRHCGPLAVALRAAADHIPVHHVERGEQRRPAMPDVVVLLGFGTAWPDAPDRSRALQRLDLGLVIERQHGRVAPRVHVQAPDNIDVRREGRVMGALEAAQSVRLQAVRISDVADRAQRDPRRIGQGTASPMGDLSGRLRAGRGQHLGHGVGGVGWLNGRAGLNALLGVALLPARVGGSANTCPLGHPKDRQMLRREPDDASALDVLERSRPISDDGKQARLHIALIDPASMIFQKAVIVCVCSFSPMCAISNRRRQSISI